MCEETLTFGASDCAGASDGGLKTRTPQDSSAREKQILTKVGDGTTYLPAYHTIYHSIIYPSSYYGQPAAGIGGGWRRLNKPSLQYETPITARKNAWGLQSQSLLALVHLHGQ